MKTPPNPALRVIGMGQEWRGDDAAGLLVARRLQATWLPRGRIVENSAAVTMLAAWQGSAAVILVDAVRGGGRPGGIYRFPVHERPLPAELFPATSDPRLGGGPGRGPGPGPEAIAASYLVVYGIEGGNFGLGQELSPAVAEAIPEVARRIRRKSRSTCRAVAGRGALQPL